MFECPLVVLSSITLIRGNRFLYCNLIPIMTASLTTFVYPLPNEPGGQFSSMDIINVSWSSSSLLQPDVNLQLSLWINDKENETLGTHRLFYLNTSTRHLSNLIHALALNSSSTYPINGWTIWPLNFGLFDPQHPHSEGRFDLNYAYPNNTTTLPAASSHVFRISKNSFTSTNGTICHNCSISNQGWITTSAQRKRYRFSDLSGPAAAGIAIACTLNFSFLMLLGYLFFRRQRTRKTQRSRLEAVASTLNDSVMMHGALSPRASQSGTLKKRPSEINENVELSPQIGPFELHNRSERPQGMPRSTFQPDEESRQEEPPRTVTKGVRSKTMSSSPSRPRKAHTERGRTTERSARVERSLPPRLHQLGVGSRALVSGSASRSRARGPSL